MHCTSYVHIDNDYRAELYFPHVPTENSKQRCASPVRSSPLRDQWYSPRKYAAANRFHSSAPGVMVAMAMYFYASRLTATAAKTPPQSTNSNSSSCNNQTSSSSNHCNSASKRSQVPTATTATAAGLQPSDSSEKVSVGGHSCRVINLGLAIIQCVWVFRFFNA